ncbi:MAG TPA: lysylphosphatidylglycerol synthase transmembrane domain-containing protein [candidate division Zixibacteria bacterium]|nr:lysylphosphatidylglycerol synthase transmembrane domain-containing protein [candidate division Zixibacteria bacterium]
MKLLSKRTQYVVLGVLISAVLIWILFRNIDFKELVAALKTANYWWLIPNAVAIFATMYQRAYRWRPMTRPMGDVPFSKLLSATWIGFMANNVLPLRLGEFVRAYSLSSQYPKISKSASLATIFTERMVFDLLALLLIFGSIIGFSDLELETKMKQGLMIAIAIALLGLVFILLLALKPNQTGKLLSRYLFFVPERFRSMFENIIAKFSQGLAFLTDAKAVINVAIQTMLIWILLGLSNVFVFWAFGFDLPLETSFVVLVVVSVSILVPSTPGFVGVYHAGAVWSLMAYGIDQESALSCAIVLHATQFIIVTVVGFYYLKKEHLSLKDLEEAAEES